MSIGAGFRLALAGLVATAACGEPTVGPPDNAGAFAKGGGSSTSQPIAVTIPATGVDLTSDGKGDYRDGICGVIALWSSEGTIFMAPGESVPQSQAASCAGIAPRSASLNLAVKHLSDTPHLDDSAPVDGGSFSLMNIKFGNLGATVINAPSPACFEISRNGRVSGKGLRFDADNFPGSNDLIRDDLGGGLWHFYTAPYPSDLGWCESYGVVSYWHVSVDLLIQVVTP